MNSKNSQSDFQKTLFYFGILVSSGEEALSNEYHDCEKFILDASLFARSSRELEGILCWLKRYGHLLAPSKLRKLIREGYPFDPFVLGAFIDFTETNSEQKCDFKILKPSCKKHRIPASLIAGPSIRMPNLIFKKRGLLVPDFALDENKFLMPAPTLLKQCLEMKFRLLFGYSVNADVAAALSKDQNLNAYRVSLLTSNHKARVFAVFQDVKTALAS